MAVASLASLAASCDGNSWMKATVKEKDAIVGLWRGCEFNKFDIAVCVSISEAFEKAGRKMRETHISILIV